jgi:hypothetical protein
MLVTRISDTQGGLSPCSAVKLRSHALISVFRSESADNSAMAPAPAAVHAAGVAHAAYDGREA